MTDFQPISRTNKFDLQFATYQLFKLHPELEYATYHTLKQDA